MRKKIVLVLVPILLILVATILILVFGNSKEQFEKDYKEIYNNIQELNYATEYVSKFTNMIWDGVGASNVISYLERAKNVSSYEDIRYTDDIYEDALKVNSNDEIIEACKEYQSCLSKIETLDNSISYSIKDLKSKHNDKYSTQITSLSEFYAESSTYAEFSTNIDGLSLVEYEKNIIEYQSNVKKLEKLSEI